MEEQKERLEAAHKIIVDAMGRTMALYGLPVALGRTYALLYLADSPLSVTEITARLGITKGTASVNIRMLERLRLVKQVWQPGRRGKFFIGERDFRKALVELMRTTAAAELATMTEALVEGERLLRKAEAGMDPSMREQARLDREKLVALKKHYESSYRMLQSLVELMEDGESLPPSSENAQVTS